MYYLIKVLDTMGNTVYEFPAQAKPEVLYKNGMPVGVSYINMVGNKIILKPSNEKRVEVVNVSSIFKE